MLFYNRFEISDQTDWSSGQPRPAFDRWMNREADAWRGPLDPSGKARQLAEATRIYSTHSRVGDPNAAEIFTTSDFLWLIVPRSATADPLIKDLRQAGLLPGMIVPPRQCSRCGKAVDNDGSLCSACNEQIQASRRRNKNALIFGSLAAAVLLAIVLVVVSFFADRPAPKIQFSQSGGVIYAGDSTTLNWTVTGAGTVSIDNAIGYVSSSGSTSVSPTSNTAYTLTAIGNGKTVTSAVTVHVLALPPRRASKPAPGDASGDTSEKPATPNLQLPQETTPVPSLPDRTIAQPEPQRIAPPPPVQQPNPSPTSGELRCPGPVPPQGQISFNNLPAGILHFDIPNRTNWRFRILPQNDGLQTVIIISMSPEIQPACDAHWTLTQ